jgi:hypothetical protein
MPKGVPAPPGVIGYVGSGPDQGKLTLKGSSEFKGNNHMERLAEPHGGLHTAPVYVAHFKHGSLVALNSSSAPGEDYTTAHIVHSPDGVRPTTWNGIKTTADAFSNAMPDGLNITEAFENDPTADHMETQGMGDPCAYYADEFFGGGDWRLPTKTEMEKFVVGKTGETSSVTFPTNPNWLIDANSRARYLPAASQRTGSAGGEISSGWLKAGFYWTSTVAKHPVTLHNYVYRLNFESSGAPDIPSNISSNLNDAYAVRCVVTLTTPTTPEPEVPTTPEDLSRLAAPGVIGYFATGPNKGELTLAGDYRYRNTDVANHPDGKRQSTIDFGEISNEAVYVAYFTFGSLVAMSSEGDNETLFNAATDIVKAPTDAMKSQITGYGSDMGPIPQSNLTFDLPYVPGYGYLDPSVESVSDASYNHSTNWDKGKGDPCIYYFGHADATYKDFGTGWKLPVGGPTNGGWNGGTFGTSGTVGVTLDLPRPDGTSWVSIKNETVTPIPTIEGVVAGDGKGGKDWSMFLPAAGYRSVSGTVQAKGSLGEYWSSTVKQNAYGINMGFRYVTNKYIIYPDGGGSYPVVGGVKSKFSFPVRCVLPPPVMTVTENVPGMVIPHGAGDMKRFTVTESKDGHGNTAPYETLYPDGNGGWTLIRPAELSWIKSISNERDIKEIWITAEPNFTQTSRTVQLLVRQTVGSKPAQQKITVTQEAAPPPLPKGVPAIPGVIGYTASGRLTLRGSSEYAGTPIETAARTMFPEGLESEPVSVAYFKFGSLVALSSNSDGSAFDFDKDIIEVPAGLDKRTIEYFGTTSAVIPCIPGFVTTDYATVKNVSDAVYNNSTNWPLGKGDPCDYYFGRNGATYQGFGSGWKLPVGGAANGGWNGGSFGDTPITLSHYWEITTGTGNGAKWVTPATYTADGHSGTLPNNGAVAGDGTGQPDWSMFLPVAGYRYSENGTDTLYGAGGFYWSSTVGNKAGYYLGFTEDQIRPDLGSPYNNAYAVRCVR